MTNNKVKVLFTTPILGHPPKGGPQLRIENSIKALSQITELYIYSRIAINDSGLSFYKSLCKEFYFSPFVAQITPISRYIIFSKRVLNYLTRKLFRHNIFSNNAKQEEEFQDVRNVADAIKADVVWLGYGNISYPLLKYIKNNSNYKVVLDTDSVWSSYVLRGLPFAEDMKERQRIEKEGREKEEEERWGTQLADVTTAVCEFDADYYRKLAKEPDRIKIFSNVIDLDNYKDIPAPPENFKKPCIYLAGSFFGPKSPMVRSARWVIEIVLPFVRKVIPHIHFYIVGKGSDFYLADIKDNNITITGELQSVLPYLYHVDVALVPLLFEASGTKFKVLEASACGIPIVATTVGAEGFPVTHEKDILIADKAEDFANGIIRLVQNPSLGREIAENSKKIVQAKYNVDQLVREGEDILKYLKNDDF
jgi:glycosyltransferase involved in cell wall biosynthesis